MAEKNVSTYKRTSKNDLSFKDNASEAAEYAKEHGMIVGPSFAEKLKKAKKEAGLTQQKMADLMLIPKRTIEDWERGINVPPAYVQRFVLNELEQIAAERSTKS